MSSILRWIEVLSIKLQWKDITNLLMILYTVSRFVFPWSSIMKSLVSSYLRLTLAIYIPIFHWPLLLLILTGWWSFIFCFIIILPFLIIVSLFLCNLLEYGINWVNSILLINYGTWCTRYQILITLFFLLRLFACMFAEDLLYHANIVFIFSFLLFNLSFGLLFDDCLSLLDPREIFFGN